MFCNFTLISIEKVEVFADSPSGTPLQTEISRIDEIGKLKTHRILKRLEARGAIIIEPFGKTNLIKLKKEIGIKSEGPLTTVK